MSTQQVIAPESIFNFNVEVAYSGSRIDKFITAQFPFYSRTFFNRLIEDEYITLNGKIVRKSSTPIKTGDTISVHFPPNRPLAQLALEQKKPAVDIIYEHEHFLIIHKPHGLLMHPPSMHDNSPTLVDWLLIHFKDIQSVGYVDRPGIVHRLDKDTSGILIIPKTNYAHTVFGNLFRERTITKKYYAIVQGHPDPKGIIDLPIGRCPITKIRMSTKSTPSSSAKMRHAITHYRVVEYFDDTALVEVMPVTGRTHQIRVHFAAIGHPLIGDQLYGKKSKIINRQALHAYSLAFHFGDTPYQFSKEPPQDFKKLIQSLRLAPKK